MLYVGVLSKLCLLPHFITLWWVSLGKNILIFHRFIQGFHQIVTTVLLQWFPGQWEHYQFSPLYSDIFLFSTCHSNVMNGEICILLYAFNNNK